MSILVNNERMWDTGVSTVENGHKTQHSGLWSPFPLCSPLLSPPVSSVLSQTRPCHIIYGSYQETMRHVYKRSIPPCFLSFLVVHVVVSGRLAMSLIPGGRAWVPQECLLSSSSCLVVWFAYVAHCGSKKSCATKCIGHLCDWLRTVLKVGLLFNGSTPLIKISSIVTNLHHAAAPPSESKW